MTSNHRAHQALIDTIEHQQASWERRSICNRPARQTNYSAAIAIGCALGSIVCGLYIILTTI